MTTQTIQARLYTGFNPGQHTPAAGLPQLPFQDITLEITFSQKLREHMLCFVKGGIKFCFSIKHIGIEAELEELIIRFRLKTTDGDGQTIYVDLSKMFPYLNLDAMAYYDPTKIGLNSFNEFELRKAAVGADGKAILGDGEFIGRRAINGLVHALGFWMQFPFDAETGALQQPLVVAEPLVTAATYSTNATTGETVANADGSIAIATAHNATGVALIYSIDGGASWVTSGTFSGLLPGQYTLLAAQSNRTGVIIKMQASV